jgi:3-deoxy-D-manno-octulosonic-acid transferase
MLWPNYSHFAEQSHWLTWACTAINNQQELNEAFEKLIRNEDIRHEKDMCSTFVQMNKGATAFLKKFYNDNVSTFKQQYYRKNHYTHARVLCH